MEAKMMKLLVIGGSYFYGRVFVMEAAKEHEITVWNQGNLPHGDVRCQTDEGGQT